MFHSKIHIEAGDLVIVFLSRDNMLSLVVTPGQQLHNKYGRYAHDDMVGMKYGSRMQSPPPHQGYIHLLRPTPELWTLSLPHRTQIVYTPDISLITMKLGIVPGSRVIEAGTGSGSMTHALARTVGPRGGVHTFEYHLQRYEKASAEFASHGLPHVHIQHRNVCRDGFGDVGDVDAVFLDLPAPWEAVPHVLDRLRPESSTKICCFSPCLEQVLKTVSTLRSHGFADVHTEEILQRTYELYSTSGAGPSTPGTITETVDRLRAHETKKAERRLIQMKHAREKAQRRKAAKLAEELAASGAPGGAALTLSGPSQEEDAGDEEEKVEEEEETVPQSTLHGHKRSLEEMEGNGEIGEGSETKTRPAPRETIEPPDSPTTAPELKKDDFKPLWTEPPVSSAAPLLCKPSAEMRGHTSYLTFATFYPKSIRQELESRVVVAAPRIGYLAKTIFENGENVDEEETEYGDDGLDDAMGTLTEEEMHALVGIS